MLENEAKNRACPMAATFAASQQIADGPGPNCVGSACMAWRWKNLKMGHDKSFQVHAHGKIEGEKRHDAYHRENPLRGFCGLAGYPQ